MFRSTTAVAGGLTCVLLSATSAMAEKITIGFGQDKPPFVNANCDDGIEVRLAEEMFARAGVEVDAQCMTNKRVVESYISGGLDAGMSVAKTDDTAYYTEKFSGFENFVITRTADGHTVDSVADLAGISAIAWNNAANVLGEEFRAVTSNNPGYEEAKSQNSQVKRFLSGRVDAVIIDKNIFRWLTKQIIENGELSGVDTDFTYHAVFPKTLDYYVGFKDQGLRDRAEAALESMRADGTYQQIVDKYLAF